MKKKIVSIILSLATIIGSLTSVTAFAYSPSSSEYNVRVLVDGVDIYGNYSGYERPFVMDGYDRTMVPLRPMHGTQRPGRLPVIRVGTTSDTDLRSTAIILSCCRVKPAKYPQLLGSTLRRYWSATIYTYRSERSARRRDFR